MQRAEAWCNSDCTDLLRLKQENAIVTYRFIIVMQQKYFFLALFLCEKETGFLLLFSDKITFVTFAKRMHFKWCSF